MPLFALAGLWERWDKGETPEETFTILTSDPNDLVRLIHDRMPVIIAPEHYDLWLDAKRSTPQEQLAPALEAFPASQMEALVIGSPDPQGQLPF